MSRLPHRLRGGVEWTLMVALVLGTGMVAQAQQQAANDEDGPVIQIGRPDADVSAPQLPPPAEGARPPGQDAEPFAAPQFWIGLVGGPIAADHPLRAHLDIPDGQGLLVANVMPDGPAAKAGLKSHDILLRANDTELREMSDLIELVLLEGQRQGQIAFEVLRRGARETVFVSPQERPADAPLAPPVAPRRGFGDGLGGFEDLFQGDAMRQLPFEFRQFAPEGLFGGPGRGAAIPDGISVSILKDADQPPRITVQRGDESWEIVGDDPEALAELPDDVRPFVERMLRDGSAIGFRPGQPDLPEFGNGRLRDRLERMERRMQELQERLLGPNDKAADDDSRQ